jgi:hypothetical protein
MGTGAFARSAERSEVATTTISLGSPTTARLPLLLK